MKGCVVIVALLAVTAAIDLLIGWVIQQLWNIVVPPIFHGPVISFWQAVALMFLVSLLSIGFRTRS